MKYALFSDIHSNLQAFEAVLEDMKKHGVEKRICLGDIVGYGPQPAECIDKVRETCDVVIKGNHDCEAAHPIRAADFNPYARDSILLTRDILLQKGAAYIDYLERLPLVHHGPKFECVHSSLVHPKDWNYIFETKEAEENFEKMRKKLLFIGHTHHPIIFGSNKRVWQIGLYDFYEKPIALDNDTRYIINVGSVGQPRDDNRDACYGVLDDSKMTFQMLRVPYDLMLTVKLLQETRVNGKSFPEKNHSRLLHGK